MGNELRCYGVWGGAALKSVVCIPTLNPGELAAKMAAALAEQTLPLDAVLILDSASTDGSLAAYGSIPNVTVVPIQRGDFDHAKTRNLAFSLVPADVYVFLTQDAIPVNRYALDSLVGALSDHPECGMVYGRQVPAASAGFLAQHARIFNYPLGSDVVLKGREDIPRLGLKAAFCSNSFAAYRREAMEQIGFFSVPTLFAEDSIAATRMFQRDWKIAYVPMAQVEHSHDYSALQDFRRYFDVGSFHQMNPWYMEFLGGAEGEGLRFVKSEYRFLSERRQPLPAFNTILRNAIRWLGYRMGRVYQYLPLFLRLKMTTNRAFWLANQGKRV